MKKDITIETVFLHRQITLLGIVHSKQLHGSSNFRFYWTNPTRPNNKHMSRRRQNFHHIRMIDVQYFNVPQTLGETGNYVTPEGALL